MITYEPKPEQVISTGARFMFVIEPLVAPASCQTCFAPATGLVTLYGAPAPACENLINGLKARSIYAVIDKRPTE